MKLQKKLFYLFFLSLFLNSCLQRNQNDPGTIFDLEGFINSQVESLARENPELKKNSRIGSESETLTIVLDSLGWQKELSIFKTADIHKPGLRDLYERNLKESGTESIEEYVLQDTSKSEILFLRIIKEKGSGLISLIEAGQQTDNPIYNSSRYLYLQFLPDDQEQVRLDSFGIRGFQKMILQDSVIYFTSGKIIRPDAADPGK
jgi:hypothetical protein